VTGGAGFIGSHLVDALLQSGASNIVVIDNMFLGKESNLSDAFTKGVVLYKEDAENYPRLEAIIEDHDIQVVFNCATKALNFSFIDPRDAFTTNVEVVGNLVELQRRGKFETLCHLSSSEVYGTAIYEPMDEQHPYNPTTTYAGGKAAADLMVRTYVSMFDVDAFIVRPFNNYGPRQNWEPPLAGIIPQTCKRILEGGAPEIHGTGEQMRDFIYVTDTVDAIVKLYEVMAPGQEVNISAQAKTTMNEVIEGICRVLNYQGEIVRKPRRGSDVDCHNATNALVMSLIGFAPRDFNQGMTETVEWYKENLQ
jgi:UDP-glucose 4-epimerase